MCICDEFELHRCAVRSRRLVLWILSSACAAHSAPRAPEAPRFEAIDPPLPWQSAPLVVRAPPGPLTVLTGGTLMTAAGPTVVGGSVAFENGTITQVLAAGQSPSGTPARTIDLAGRFVTPGLIDVHSHLGVYASPDVHATDDGNEATSPVTAEVRAADSFWAQDPGLQRALAAGVTTIEVLPGSTNLIGGVGVILKLHLGRSAGEMRFPGAPDTLKMACGENPKRVYGERDSAPSTRMGNVAGYRRAFQKASEYGRSWRDWQHQHRIWQSKRARFEAGPDSGETSSDKAPEDPGPAPAPPTRDLASEVLLGAIEGRILVQTHCYRADDMLNMIAVSREFGFRIRSFHHAVEAYKIRDVLALHSISVSTWPDWWGFKLEAFDAIPENLALLTEQGVTAILHSDSAMLVQRFGQEAGKAMAAGRRVGIDTTEDQALRWITRNPAWALGIDQYTGSLEVGKMADIVVWSGHPFSVYSHVDMVFIDGILAYDRTAPEATPPTDFELGWETAS